MYRGRFAVLWHHWILAAGKDDSHWDLLLELDSGKLLTWRISQLPFLSLKPEMPRSANRVEAIRLPDHRAVYLDYEGPIDNDRGHVTRRAGGDYVACLSDLSINDPALPADQLRLSELGKSPGQPLSAGLTLNGILQVRLVSPELKAEFRIELSRVGESAVLQLIGD